MTEPYPNPASPSEVQANAEAADPTPIVDTDRAKCEPPSDLEVFRAGEVAHHAWAYHDAREDYLECQGMAIGERSYGRAMAHLRSWRRLTGRLHDYPTKQEVRPQEE